MNSIEEQNEALAVESAKKYFPKCRWIGVWARKEKRCQLFEVVTMHGLGHGFGAPENYQRAFTVGFEWKPQDLWIGAFWKREYDDLLLWICLVPCIPVRLHWKKSYSGGFLSPGPTPPIDPRYRRRWWQ